MTGPRTAIALAGLGSAALLFGALGFQYIGELAPCPMCIWQRWPHVAAILIAILALTVLWQGRRVLAALGAIAMAISTGLGIFHAGVEQGWWEGPATCTGAAPGDLSVDDLMKQVMEAPLVRCDEIAWEFGLTMAGWNAAFSLVLFLLWVSALSRRA